MCSLPDCLWFGLVFVLVFHVFDTYHTNLHFKIEAPRPNRQVWQPDDHFPLLVAVTGRCQPKKGHSIARRARGNLGRVASVRFGERQCYQRKTARLVAARFFERARECGGRVELCARGGHVIGGHVRCVRFDLSEEHADMVGKA